MGNAFNKETVAESTKHILVPLIALFSEKWTRAPLGRVEMAAEPP
jgi:hypothetical protein